MYFMAVKKSNEKQRARNINEPHGHNFEAVAHLKQFSIAFISSTTDAAAQRGPRPHSFSKPVN